MHKVVLHDVYFSFDSKSCSSSVVFVCAPYESTFSDTCAIGFLELANAMPALHHMIGTLNFNDHALWTMLRYIELSLVIYLQQTHRTMPAILPS